MNLRHRVLLSPGERAFLEGIVRGGASRARRIKRAQILLAAADGVSIREMHRTIGASQTTICRAKRDFAERGLEGALKERPRIGAPRKLSMNEEATLVAVACTKPPAGRARWTTQLLADEMVRLTKHEFISSETIRRRLVEKKLKPWQEKMWCIAEMDAEYVARMEDVLDLYAEPADPQRPVVCVDETTRQLLGDERMPTPPKCGKPARIDYHYARHGTANIFLAFDRHNCRRHAKATKHRTALDFAEFMRELVDVHYPGATLIRVVVDNLNTHNAASLYRRFPAEEARRLLRKIEFHYTPKHASWLNMVEIEIGIMSDQCLDRRIPEMETLTSELAHWERQRNADRGTIRWLFTVDAARVKLARAYPLRSTIFQRAVPAARAA
jgi:transposase